MPTPRTTRLAGLILLGGFAVSAAAVPLGLEVRAYPAGAIVAADWRLGDTETLKWGVLAGYNFARRGDAGRHDDEDGGGPGLGIYAQQGLPQRPWFWGARLELFQLDIDWREADGRGGSSEVSVLQPTVSLGYRWLAGSPVEIELAAHLGAEINLSTRGESVGEGPIGLLGLRLSLPRAH